VKELAIRLLNDSGVAPSLTTRHRVPEFFTGTLYFPATLSGMAMDKFFDLLGAPVHMGGQVNLFRKYQVKEHSISFQYVNNGLLVGD
jgi:hypothetical protein